MNMHLLYVPMHGINLSSNYSMHVHGMKVVTQHIFSAFQPLVSRYSVCRACLKIRVPIKYSNSPGVYLALTILLASARRFRASIKVSVHVRRWILLWFKLSCSKLERSIMGSTCTWDHCYKYHPHTAKTHNTYKPLLVASSCSKLWQWCHRPSSSSCSSAWTWWSPLCTVAVNLTALPRPHRLLHRPTAAHALLTRWNCVCAPTCWTC